MVEHVAISRDRKSLIYDANIGATKDDDDRRHLFRVPVDAARPIALTAGTTLEWAPVAASPTVIAFISSDSAAPPSIATIGMDGRGRKALTAGVTPSEFPQAALIVPRSVSFKAADGLLVHGQLFDDGVGTRKPALIFVHGGPPRQMLLGWHYMDCYSNSYAVNQSRQSRLRRSFRELPARHRLRP